MDQAAGGGFRWGPRDRRGRRRAIEYWKNGNKFTLLGFRASPGTSFSTLMPYFLGFNVCLSSLLEHLNLTVPIFLQDLCPQN